MTTVQQALFAAVAQLRAAGIDTAPKDARRLLASALGIAPDRISLHMHDPLDDFDAFAQIAFDGLLTKRAARVPVSHLLGGREFYGRWFTVTPDVLDPRPETECLIAAALAAPFATFLDLGTGSGAIAVTLAAERPATTGIATDISVQALDVAGRNAESLAVADRIGFVQSRWFQAIDGTFDLIVSNPPYIALDEMDGLQPEVQLHEPRLALTDEADGLSAYRTICAQAPAYLTWQGRLMVEIGPTQAAAVSQMMQDAGLVQVQVLQDLDGRDRIVAAHMPQ
ncbi:[protein release factor]-glutamine N5-methyltransferase [Yoonia tamlensis]|uniref:Release factor glutamine methyltransferase n=1 Tax=Yoonia tamlensis TaxID=390270 RepID=A0A1I6GFK3_9RHOB|nr:peptide chain release factor N(5)-glutamine methyltransferase [Yoonia tamlensis]SFR40910.1 [protein release factor]-glutamine N5-methyltransferase [Yoonia tamlensis]